MIRLWLGLMAAGAASLTMLSGGCDKPPPTNPARVAQEPKRLAVLTPHNAEIRYAFAAGFQQWLGEPVHIEWIYRGTPQCVEYVLDVPRMQAEGAPFTRPDVMFGGGIADHVKLAENDFCLPLDIGDAMARIPDEINGMPTRDPAGRWFATGLSTFGIFANTAACRVRGVTPPQTWEDLAAPEYFDWVVVADPAASGSHRECLVTILQVPRLAWGERWETVMRILANTRQLAGRSSRALDMVSEGHYLATFAVNFDGQMRAEQRADGLAYADPPEATTATPDVISALALTKDPELTQKFVEYTLSPEGQALWIMIASERPVPGMTLYHYPIDPEVYALDAAKLSLGRNPWEEPFAIATDVERHRLFGTLVDFLAEVAGGAVHVELQQAWRTLIEAGLPEAAVAALLQAPFESEEAALAFAREVEAADAETRAARVAEWQADLKQRCQQAVATAGE